MVERTVREIAEVMAAKTIASRDELDQLLSARSRPCRIQTVNLHHVHLARRDDIFFEALVEADFVTADGWPIVWMLGALDVRPDRVTGSEYIERLAHDPDQAISVALLGATHETGEAFARLLGSNGHSVTLREHGRWRDWDVEALAEAIALRGIDLVVVAVSPPAGEVVASNLTRALHHRSQGAHVIAVGGAVDMAVGVQRTAPQWASRIGLEWLFRLAGNPRRLARRYLLEGIPEFALGIVPFRITAHFSSRGDTSR